MCVTSDNWPSLCLDSLGKWWTIWLPGLSLYDLNCLVVPRKPLCLLLISTFGLVCRLTLKYTMIIIIKEIMYWKLFFISNLLKFLNLSNKAKRCLPSLTNKLISIAIFLMAIHKIHKPLIWSRYQAVHCTGYIRGDSEHQGNDCWLKPHWSVQQN